MSIEEAMTEIERIVRELAADGTRVDHIQLTWIDRMDGKSHLLSADFDIRKCNPGERDG